MVTIKVQWELRRYMPDFAYNRDVPLDTHNPSTDQPDMKINTNSIDSIIAVDHYSFQEVSNQDGWHKQSTYPVLGVAPATLALQGAVYTKNVGAGVSQLFYRRENNGTEIQLTGLATVAANNGYITLPGGIIIQWGVVNTTSTNGTVLFVTSNIDFPNACFNIQTTAKYNSGVAVPAGSGNYGPDTATFDKTGFDWILASNSGSWRGFFWTAIGN